MFNRYLLRIGGIMKIIFTDCDARSYERLTTGGNYALAKLLSDERIELTIRDDEKQWIVLVLNKGEALAISQALSAISEGSISAAIESKKN